MAPDAQRASAQKSKSPYEYWSRGGYYLVSWHRFIDALGRSVGKVVTDNGGLSKR